MSAKVLTIVQLVSRRYKTSVFQDHLKAFTQQLIHSHYLIFQRWGRGGRGNPELGKHSSYVDFGFLPEVSSCMGTARPSTL